MKDVQQCEQCGALHVDADKHRLFHEDLAAWIHLIELEAEARRRSERSEPEDEE